MEYPDELLPLSRRLDWRFLLPDPSLRRVYYRGPAGSLLFKALRRLSTEVVDDSASRNDLAVLVNPSVREFKQALATSGSFYVELHRRTWPQRLLRRTTPKRYLRLAEACGFQAQAYWHYPSFDAANRMIPLAVAPPVLHVVAKEGRGLRARLKTFGMYLFFKSGLLVRTVSCLSIVGSIT